MANLFRNCTPKRLKVDGTNYTAVAGITPVTSEPIDTLGFTGVAFMVSFGAIVTGAVTSIKVRCGSQANMSDAADVATSSQTVTDASDNKIFIVDINRPYERYLDVVTTRGTQNATVDSLVAILYGSLNEVPLTHDALVGGVEFINGTNEGQA